MDCIDGTLAHYWEIQPSNGASSNGTCKKCKQTKKFANSVGALTSWREAGQTFKQKRDLKLGRKEGK